jgi:hypothetical protein
MAEYTVMDISPETPREWGEGSKKTYYIKVKVKGHDKPISVGKRSPDALVIGQIISGEIQTTTFDTDNFKPTTNVPGARQPRDDEAIKAQFSIKTAVAAIGIADITAKDYLSNVETLARSFYEMIERVKAGPKEESKKDVTVTTEYGDEPPTDDSWN